MTLGKNFFFTKHVDRDEVEKKMQCLIGQYQINSKKSKSGSAADNDKKWPYYNLFLFLKDKCNPRQFKDTSNMNKTVNSKTFQNASDEPSGPLSNAQSKTHQNPENVNPLPQQKVAKKKRKENYTWLMKQKGHS